MITIVMRCGRRNGPEDVAIVTVTAIFEEGGEKHSSNASSCSTILKQYE